MEGADLFATKGLEYLIVIGFLVLLIGYWRILQGGEARPVAAPDAAAGRSSAAAAEAMRWYGLPAGLLFHQGHSWARPGGLGLVTVGIDDFAGKLLGEPDALELPRPGTRLHTGQPAWRVRVGGGSVAMVSPVDGEVVAVNPAVVAAPSLASREPYDAGWLLEVQVQDPEATTRNLLRGELAREWLERSAERLRAVWTSGLGVLLPDGGAPIQGFARALGGEGDGWVEVAEEFLLVSSSHGDRNKGL